MRIHDFVIPAVLACLAIYVVVTAASFPKLAGLAVGPGLFPVVLGAALFVGAGLLALERRGGVAPAGEADSFHPQARMRLVAVLGACALFAGFGDFLGFLIAGTLAIAILLVAFGVPVLRSAIIAVVSVVLLNLFFVKVMRIPLPRGLLSGFGGWL
jgi:putative tricarboxylic transport membrane protein